MSWDPYGPMDVETFVQMPPPRRVPPSIRKAAAPRGAVWTLILFGSLFLGMGLLFTWIFVPRSLLKQRALEDHSAAVTPGRITAVEPTNMTVNNVRVVKYRFSYQLTGERKREGEAYSSGGKWNTGDQVKVRYLDGDPSYAIPEGARLDKSDATTLFVLMFPLIGGGVLAGSLSSLFGRNRLLAHGWFSTATVAGMDTTSVRINHHHQYKFRIIRADDQKEITVRRHLPHEVAMLQAKMASKEPVKILFDPNKPRRMMFPETWSA